VPKVYDSVCVAHSVPYDLSLTCPWSNLIPGLHPTSSGAYPTILCKVCNICPRGCPDFVAVILQATYASHGRRGIPCFSHASQDIQCNELNLFADIALDLFAYLANNFWAICSFREDFQCL